MEWSFQRVNSYITCPRMFYLTYVQKEEKRENFFQQYGSFFHKVMEKYGNGELELFELIDYYKDNYKMFVTLNAPYNKWKDLDEEYYNMGLKYLEAFQGFENPVIQCETPIEFTIDTKYGQKKFVGYVDRIDEDGDSIDIVDYKSKKQFKDQDELSHYLIQLYLYSVPAMKLSNKNVKKLVFDMFRAGKKIQVEWKEQEYKKAVNWAKTTIEKIYTDEIYDRNKDPEKDFFCKELCSCYNSCIQNNE